MSAEETARVGRPPSCTCGTCRKCKHRAYMHKWYRRMTPTERRAWIARRDKDSTRERDRERYQRSKAKRTALIKARKPKKIRAMKSVHLAIARGDLVRPTKCERCSAETEVQAHHPNYSRPLDVQWLCATCHGREHRKPDSEFVGGPF